MNNVIRNTCESGKYDRLALFVAAKDTQGGRLTITYGDCRMERCVTSRKCQKIEYEIPRETQLNICLDGVSVPYAYMYASGDGSGVRQLIPDRRRNESEAGASKQYRNHNTFHFSPQTGWMNDPNGLCYFRGKYHMFYQFNPASQQWGDVFWGHATSTDLLHWTYQPVVFCPQPELLDREDRRGGAFSGTALIQNDEMHLFFTRHYGNMERTWCHEYTLMASSRDGITFPTERVLIDRPPEGLDENFRDPMVFRHDSEWLMLTGTRENNIPCVSVHVSKDLKEWRYRGIFLKEEDPQYLQAECPCIMRIGDAFVLIVGYHNRPGATDQIRRDSVYYVGEIHDYSFIAHKRGLLDEGKDFYAVQAITDSERPIIIGWNNDLTRMHNESLDYTNGTMGIPRKVSIDDGNLRTFPIEEFGAADLCDGQSGTEIVLDDSRGHLVICQQLGLIGSIKIASCEKGDATVEFEEKQVKIRVAGETWFIHTAAKKVDFFIDNSLIELFINDGERAFTVRFEHRENVYHAIGHFKKSVQYIHKTELIR